MLTLRSDNSLAQLFIRQALKMANIGRVYSISATLRCCRLEERIVGAASLDTLGGRSLQRISVFL